MRYRFKKLLLVLSVLFGMGIAYYMLYLCDIHIPCMINKLTGYQCPGCGMTRMVVSLINLDFGSAFHYHAAAMIMLPFWFAVATVWSYRYVRCAETQMTKWMNAVIMTSSVLLLVFAILRNHPMIMNY